MATGLEAADEQQEMRGWLEEVAQIEARWRALEAPSTPSSVRLARVDAPLGRTLGDEDRVTVRWTLDAGTPDAILRRDAGKVILRHHRILRLMAEAQAQGAAPTDADLARALNVTERTIVADIAALRAMGHELRTRRRR
jgi:hypothetical protein